MLRRLPKREEGEAAEPLWKGEPENLELPGSAASWRRPNGVRFAELDASGGGAGGCCLARLCAPNQRSTLSRGLS